jgi:WD40 repeat protein
VLQQLLPTLLLTDSSEKPSQQFFGHDRSDSSLAAAAAAGSASSSTATTTASDGSRLLLEPEPFRVLDGHTADIIDLCWNRTFFLLSASTDCTVRLWHVSQAQCLSVFKVLYYAFSMHMLCSKHMLCSISGGCLCTHVVHGSLCTYSKQNSVRQQKVLLKPGVYNTHTYVRTCSALAVMLCLECQSTQSALLLSICDAQLNH